MTKFFSGSNGSEPITIYDDTNLKITTTVPSQFALKGTSDWENDNGTNLQFTVTNNTPFTITVSAIVLKLAMYEPHGPSNNYTNQKNLRVRWDTNNETGITLTPSNPLGPKSSDQSLKATMDFYANTGTNGSNGDCYLQAIVSYTVSGSVNTQPGINSNGDATGVKGTWVSV